MASFSSSRIELDHIVTSSGIYLDILDPTIEPFQVVAVGTRVPLITRVST